ncbi:hypothetical protein HMPREF9120_00439 [Neisseria sp. oral taxon 020 str. F0370]|nr:hypothetical protein HMPREF9120_00439 [Neisseria sp. oral taxon 020 str. F0370]
MLRRFFQTAFCRTPEWCGRLKADWVRSRPVADFKRFACGRKRVSDGLPGCAG